ncbi:hypothetical protein ACFQY5_15210 [Paeniroseomonas aquatica]|uniref:hypothetical protein n=1 Tax=Paeniroseomonas aquatica TaxID=373043 RepID=UPI003614F3B2
MTAHLAITMGDPAGIGPEIIVKACQELAPRLADGTLKLLVIGHGTALERARAAFGPALRIPHVAAGGDWPPWPSCRPGRSARPSPSAASRRRPGASPTSPSSRACAWPRPAGSARW